MDNLIFDKETMDSTIAKPQNRNCESGVVMCLGQTFETQEECDNYFREQLRTKLEQLHSVEGFPLGADEDIISLSKPPYYTACPNPWIGEIIEQWEEEKTELEKEGKRTADFEVNEPYASDVSEGKNNPIYMAHAYHTKVPHPAIMRYILHYTQPGDIVFDGFAGTGMTGVAAQMCGVEKEVVALHEKNAVVGVRHAICSDLSPIATMISAQYNLDFDPLGFENSAKSILDQVDKELGWMYRTKVEGNDAKINYFVWSDVFICPHCGEEIVLFNEMVDLENETMRDNFPCPHCGLTLSKKSMEKAWETTYDDMLGETVRMNKRVPVRVNYTTSGGKRGEKRVEQCDLDLLEKIKQVSLKDCINYRIPIGDETLRNEIIGVTHLHQFYSRRNYIYLNRVNELAHGNLFLQSWVTSSMFNSSKMNIYRFGVGTYMTGTLYIPSLSIEQSPNHLLTNKIKTIITALYPTRGNSIVSLNSATSLPNIPSDSIDYIFTDPPFGANIMYSELNSLWEGWLKVLTNNKEEAIINKTQQKSLFDYQHLMSESLKEYYRVLKPNHWLTMEFSNTAASVWNSIQNALQSVGFVVVNVAALDKQQGSFKAVTTTTAVKQDLVITCYKPSTDLTTKFEKSTNKQVNVWDFIEELLDHLPVVLEKDKSTTAVVERSPKILFDRLISYYVQNGYQIPLNASSFQAGLRDHFVERDGMFFTTEQAPEYEAKKAQAENKFVQIPLLISSEADGIEWLKGKLMNESKTYAELQPDWMHDLVAAKKGDQIPELLQILQENFIKEENGHWHIPNHENARDLEQLRTSRLLKEFNSYVDEAKKPRGKIKEARVEALRCGFKDCYSKQDFATIILVGNKLLETLLSEDETLLQYYNIAQMYC